MLCAVSALSLPLVRMSPRCRAMYSPGDIGSITTAGLNSRRIAQPASSGSSRQAASRRRVAVMAGRSLR